MKNEHGFVTNADRRRLGVLLATPDGQAWGTQPRLAELESVLEEATPVESDVAPETLVTMNTTVELIDCNSGASRVVTLAYPQDLDLVQDGVSVFEPLGIALIGCQVGDVVECPAENQGREMRVAQIVYQPERAGARHL